MLRVVLKNLARTNRLLQVESRASYIRGYWPEPITQQTLDEFLNDINYFDEPRKFTNIGLETDKIKKDKNFESKKQISETISDETTSKIKIEPDQIDELLNTLGQEAETPPLDYDDCKLQGSQLMNLAISQGIFRDLFGKYAPDREYIKFTQEQAERMAKLVPHFWITDQPYARIDRSNKEPDPLPIFEPVVGISARFINEQQSSQNQQDSDLYAHTSYHGNIIPASEALDKPSITLDGHLLKPHDTNRALVTEKAFNNWTPGTITAVNFDSEQVDKYYSVALINLDHLHEDSANLHWMVTNIKPSSTEPTLEYEEPCEYLPVHGIRGFGYSRYVFIVFQHDSKVNTNNMKINDFSLNSRKFDANRFLDEHKSVNMKPAGLSWFQTTWDNSSNNIFHQYLKIKAPVYDHVQAKVEAHPDPPYPNRVAFNVYLDHHRNKKEINEQVLLERLSIVDPFDYKDQYVPPKVPPTIHEEPLKPSWMKQVMFKKHNKIGYWRGLRPASMSLPLENNADLDYPIRPVASSKKRPPEFPNQYPGKIKYKLHKDMPTSKPANEHQHVFIVDDHEVHLDQVRKVMKEFEKEKAEAKR